MFGNWIIAKKNNTTNNSIAYHRFENQDHCILIDNLQNDEDYYWDENNKEGVFIIGYILPVLSLNTKVTPLLLLNSYKQAKEESFLNYKGNFTLIIVLKNEIVLVSDTFGISKFFYNNEIASNNLWIFKDYSDISVSLEAMYLYSIFNYWIKDYTLFKNISKSEGGYYYLVNSDIIKKQYFSISSFLRNREIKYTKKSTFKYAPELWTEVLNQYLKGFHNNRISQTLTAGLDSRMILAGFRKLNFTPETFTFGNIDSMDVHFAKIIASELNLRHYHYYPDSNFYENFKSIADEVIDIDHGLSTLFRAHRLDAYKKLSNISEVVFFGFIGSEIIRGGVYPDGLIYPNFVLDFWLGKKISVEGIIRNNFLKIDKKIISTVERKIFDKFDFYKEPDAHIFETIIPLHFGQDIRLLEELGISSVAPFWDIDFLNFQKSTPYFIDNSKKADLSKLGHFKRRKGPIFSCKIIELLDSENARISLGKGYSPRDFNLSSNYAALKFLLNRYSKIKNVKTSNFSYNKWFYDFLQISTKEYNSQYIDKSVLLSKLSTSRSTDESGLLSFAKHANIGMIIKSMNRNI